MHKKFARSYDSLKEIYDFTEAVLDAGRIEDTVRYPVHFAMEELFTNLVKYNPDNDQEVLFEVEADDGTVTVTITDNDVDAFDVTAARDVDTAAPLSERKAGGLGLHLICHMVDSLNYRYADRQSRIRFTKGTN